MTLGFAAAILLLADSSGAAVPVLHGRDRIAPEGAKSVQPQGRFSRESRALQLCRSRAARLGRVTINGVGVPRGEGYTFTGRIDVQAGTAAGSTKRQLNFTCLATRDGVLRSFKAQRAAAAK